MLNIKAYQGISGIIGSRDAIRQTLQIGLIEDGRWMDTISDRNLSSHNYDDETAKKIVSNIISIYYPLFVKYESAMLAKLDTDK